MGNFGDIAFSFTEIEVNFKVVDSIEFDGIIKTTDQFCDYISAREIISWKFKDDISAFYFTFFQAGFFNL